MGDMGWISREASFGQLAVIPGIDKEAHSRAQCLDGTGETVGGDVFLPTKVKSSSSSTTSGLSGTEAGGNGRTCAVTQLATV